MISQSAHQLSRTLSGSSVAARAMHASSVHERISRDHFVDQRVNEIILPSELSIALVLPCFAHLSRTSEQRWLTWIDDTHWSKTELTAYQFELTKTRLVYRRGSQATEALCIDALQNGASHTVVACVRKIDQQALDRCEQAARIGNSRAVFIRYSQSQLG